MPEISVYKPISNKAKRKHLTKKSLSTLANRDYLDLIARLMHLIRCTWRWVNIAHVPMNLCCRTIHPTITIRIGHSPLWYISEMIINHFFLSKKTEELVYSSRQSINALNEKIPVDVSLQELSGFDCSLGILDTKAMGEHCS